MSAQIQSVRFRAFCTSGLVALVAGLIGGCQAKTGQAKTDPPASSQLAAIPKAVAPPDAPATQPVVVVPSEPLSPDALRDRIAEYARTLEQQPPHRAKPATQPVADATTAPATRPAAPLVKAVANIPDPRVVAVATPPTVDNQPSHANQSITLEEKGTDAARPAAGTMTVSPDELNRTVTPSKQQAFVGNDLDVKLAKHLQDSPKDVWAHLDYQLLQFLKDEQVPQLDALSTLPIEDRELMTVVMDGLSNFRNGLRADNNMLLSRKIKPLMELGDRLRSQADLNIPVMALCTQVETFGVYTPIEPLRFLNGKEHETLLYCEVENFASLSLADKKMWETRLSQEATLYTESGLPIWTDKAGRVVDRARNRRHDFYLVKRMKFPASLPLGRYVLKVTVEDQEAKRIAEQTMQLEIVAQLETEVAGDK